VTCDDPLEFLDNDSLLPQDGVTVTSEYNPLTLQIRAPLIKPGCSTYSRVYVYIGLIRNDCDYSSFSSGFHEPGELVTALLSLNDFTDGEDFAIEFDVEAEGAMIGMGINARLTYNGPEDPVRITNCFVYGATVGKDLDIRCSARAPGGRASLTDGWDLIGGPDGTAIADGNIARPDAPMEADEVALHDFSVTATDGIRESVPKLFSIPVDVHCATLSFEIFGGGEMGGLSAQSQLPEETADALASACADGYDSSLKPASAGDAPYTTELDRSCAEGFFDALSAKKRLELFLYPVNQGEDFSFGDLLQYDGLYGENMIIVYESDAK
jgi:hypothetical protein